MASDTVLQQSQAPMGATPTEAGVVFRVWAPHAESVAVIGEFNDWSDKAHPLSRLAHGLWQADVDGAKVGQQYKYRLTRGGESFDRIDPYAREVSNSVGASIVHDPAFDWEDDDFTLPNWNELVIYEMHLGTFNRPDGENVGGFDSAIAKLDYLRDLGVNAVELMPVAEFAGDYSWGYNPAHIFAVESAYGGPAALKRFVLEAHRRGIGVLLDVVYNHFGPSDLDLWRFDGWSENDKGGIYFYNDWRSSTPWGDTRPDYGRGEVRQFIFDNAMMWLDEYRVDGLRFDMTLFIRSVRGDSAHDLPEGWSLTQWLNREVAKRYPGRITIAEDLQNNEFLTKAEELGGANFGSQWDAKFVHTLRAALTTPEDGHRSMHAVRDALLHRYNIDVFERVVYTESHDEVANGKQRVPSEINPKDPDGWAAQKRSTLGAALTMTAPGIPMLFQGQEFLRTGWFDDARAIDWQRSDRFRGLVRLYRDLIALRRNLRGLTRGLTGQGVEVFHVNEADKVIAFRRFDQRTPGDDTLVLANFANRDWDHYAIGAPNPGAWRLRFNSAWRGYSTAFDDVETGDATAEPVGRDGLPATLTTPIEAYACLIFSQEAPA